MSNPSHLIQAAFNAPNLPRKSIGQRAYVGLLIATTGASVLCGGSAAHSELLPLRHRSFRVIVRCRLGELNNLCLTLLLFQRDKIYR